MANNDLLLRINVQTGQAITQLNGLDRQLNTLTGSVNTFSNSFVRNSTVANILASSIQKLTSNLLQMASVNFSNFIQLESTIANISVLSEKAIKDTQKYNNVLLKLSNDIGLSATDTAKGVQMLLQAGVENQQEALSLLTKLQQFSIATGASLEETANTLLILRANFKLTGTDIDTTLNQIAVAAARSRLNIGDFAAEFGSIAGILKPANISVGEGAAFFALLADKLSSAAEASVSFKAMVSKIGNPTGDMQKWLDTINKSMNTSIVFSPSAIGKAGGFEPFMKNFLTTVQDFANKNKYAVADILAQMFEEVKSSRGLQGVVDEIVSGTKFTKLNDEILNNTEFLKRAYGETSKTLGIQFKSLGISINNVFMEFFVRNREFIQKSLDNFVYFANGVDKTFRYIGTDLLTRLGQSFTVFGNSKIMQTPFKNFLDFVLTVVLSVKDNIFAMIDLVSLPFQRIKDLFSTTVKSFLIQNQMIGDSILHPTKAIENLKNFMKIQEQLDKDLQKRNLQRDNEREQILLKRLGAITMFSSVDNELNTRFKTTLPDFSMTPQIKNIGKGKVLDTISLPTDTKTGNKTQANKEQKDIFDNRLELLKQAYDKQLIEDKRYNILFNQNQVQQFERERQSTLNYLSKLEKLKKEYAGKDKNLKNEIQKEISKTENDVYNLETSLLKEKKDIQLKYLEEVQDAEIKSLVDSKERNEQYQKERILFLEKQSQDLNNLTSNIGLKIGSAVLGAVGFDTSIINTAMNNVDAYKNKQIELTKAVKDNVISQDDANKSMNEYSNGLDAMMVISTVPTVVNELSRSFDALRNATNPATMATNNFFEAIAQQYKAIPFLGEQISKLTLSIGSLFGITKTDAEKQKLKNDLDYELNLTKERNRMYLDDQNAKRKADLDAEYGYNLKLIEGQFDYEKQKNLLDLKYSNDREELRKEELKSIQDYNDKSYSIEKKTLDDTFTKRKENLKNEVDNIKNSIQDVNKAYSDLFNDRTQEQQQKQSLKGMFLSSLASRETNLTADFYRQTQAEADLFFNNSESSINRLFNMGDIGTDEKRAKQQQLALDKYLYYQNQLKLTQSPETKASIQKQMDDAQEKYYEYAIDKEKQALDKKKKALQMELNIKLDNLKIAESEEMKMINRLDQKYKDLAGNYKNYMIDANSNWINTAYNNPTQINSSKSSLGNPLNSVSNVTPTQSNTSNKSLIDSLRSTYGMTNEQFNNSFGSYSMEQLQALAKSQGITSFNNQNTVNNSPSSLSNPNNFNPTVVINGADLSNPLVIQTAVRTELNNMKNSISRSGF